MPDLTVVDHPLLKRDVTILRDKRTPYGRFRDVINDAASILAYESMRDLPLRETRVDTPLETTTGHEPDTEVVVVPVLRAGLGLVDGFVRFLPESRVGHLGMYRDEKTHQPVDYYANIPGGLETARVFVVDPMLATGNSATAALDRVKADGPADVRFLCLLAAPEGVERLHDSHPDVPIWTAALDDHLNEVGYIVPGLGDAGDRIFGTT